MEIRDAVEEDFAAVTSIYNEIVRNSTAIYNSQDVPVEERLAWWRERTAKGYPVVVGVESGLVVGFGTAGPFRSWPGYRYTVEGTIHLAQEARGRGLGRELLAVLVERSRAMGMHSMVAAIDSENEASLRFFAREGFVEVGRLPEVGWKFERWLTLVLLQRML